MNVRPETENPRRDNRGFTIKESLEAMRELYPGSGIHVKPFGGPCEDCLYFRQVTRNVRLSSGKTVKRPAAFCHFSGEATGRNKSCEFFTPKRKRGGTMLEHIKKAFEVEGLSAIEKVTLIALADYANEEGVCWPSHKALMKKTGIGNKKTLWKSLASLENNGLLEINKAGQNEKKTANIYKLFVGDSDFSRCTFRRSKVRRSNFVDLVGTKVHPEATIEDTSIYTPSPLEGGAYEFGTDEASPEPELTTLTGTFPVDERPTPVQQEPTGGSDETNPLTEAENDDLEKKTLPGAF